jgi:hypothetical protein
MATSDHPGIAVPPSPSAAGASWASNGESVVAPESLPASVDASLVGDPGAGELEHAHTLEQTTTERTLPIIMLPNDEATTVADGTPPSARLVMTGTLVGMDRDQLATW